jgi:UDP-N-acetylmuramyl pentapeptide phosphotransferase/UDP-N-acetylglucosamine-1-phosphate transferase
MNLTLQSSIQLAGALQLITAAANFFLPAKLHYRENLAKVSPIVRQIFTVHSIYIVLVLIGFGLICLLFPDDLSGTSALGKFVCGFLALFWGLRVVLQFAYYDGAVKKEHPLGALFFGTVFLYLAVIFTTATFLGK